jgi:hypothetical protein
MAFSLLAAKNEMHIPDSVALRVLFCCLDFPGFRSVEPVRDRVRTEVVMRLLYVLVLRYQASSLLYICNGDGQQGCRWT